ncbi:hypothetical protein MNBD_GAMMA15-588 [hydrothermal vent metagenome]|uniref:SnoaL-like domain-containing protein n=1 Tax=hydrothermal vent metagenome TaxID=652676 RepID=A0A3B0YTB1_9ZZZZ
MSKPTFPTPEEAEQAFYDAFANADLGEMMAVWAERDFIECIHPMCDRAQGFEAVEESWREIFDGGLRVQFKLSRIHRTQDALIAVHVHYEHLSTADDENDWPPVIATNVFQLVEGSWRIVHHHASPCPDEDDNIEAEDTAVITRQLH